jgi:hypothetical protein
MLLPSATGHERRQVWLQYARCFVAGLTFQLAAGLEHLSDNAAGNRRCIATLSYIYDHAERELPKRLTRDFHEYHDLAQVTRFTSTSTTTPVSKSRAERAWRRGQGVR